MSGSMRAVGQKEIPALTTMSLRLVMDSFKTTGKSPTYTVTELRARASDLESDKPSIENESLGFKGWKARTEAVFDLNYSVDWDKTVTPAMPTNPLDQANIDRITDALSDVGIDDSAVSKVRVLINDPELGKRAGNGEDLWHMTLISDPVDGRMDKMKVQEHSVNTALIKDEHFKYRILNCRDLIDRKQELTLPRTQHTPVISWVGNTFAGMRSKPSVVQRIVRSHLGKYRLRKVYGADKEDTVILLSVSR